MSSNESNIEILEQFVVEKRKKRLDEVLNNRTSSLTIVLENIRNPHNISAVLRSADAFGIHNIHLVSDNQELDYSSGISLGTERWVNLTYHDSSQKAVTSLQKSGYSLVVLQPEEDNRFDSVEKLAVVDLPFGSPLALVFGNEHSGVSEEFVKSAQYHAYIPMFGFVESLNISVACAITLFSSTLKNANVDRRLSPLDDKTKLNVRAEWLEKSVRGSEIILRDIDRRSEE